MKKLRVLLVCGSGASSGFMAANIRKAASARGLDVSVVARSESEIESYIDEIDVLMAGPHLAYIMDEVDELAEANPDLKVDPHAQGLLRHARRRGRARSHARRGRRGVIAPPLPRTAVCAARRMPGARRKRKDLIHGLHELA